MTMTVPSDIQSKIDSRVAVGLYPSSEDVLLEAFAALEDWEKIQALREDLIRAEEQFATGRYSSYSAEDSKAFAAKIRERAMVGIDDRPRSS